jgi:AraC-like DNA-binding protein
MMVIYLAREHANPASCRAIKRHIRVGAQVPVLLCLDRVHRVRMQQVIGSRLAIASCPLQVRELLDSHPQQQVILDRCPAKLQCCRRPVGDLEFRIRRLVHRQPDRLAFINESRVDQAHRPATLLTNGLQQAIQRFRDRPPQQVTLQDLADAFGVGPRQLNRLSRSELGISAMRAFRRFRLFDGLREIRNSTRSIESVAERLNYCDRSSFARAFRRAFGIYPGRLRRLSQTFKT